MSTTDAISSTLAAVAAQAGFRPRAGAWYRDVPVGVQVIELQKSSWGEQYYFNLGIHVRDLGAARSPKPHQCHFNTRATSLDREHETHWKQVMDLEAPLDDAARRREVARLLSSFVIPFLDALSTKDGLRLALLQGQLADGMVMLQLKQYLGAR